MCNLVDLLHITLGTLLHNDSKLLRVQSYPLLKSNRIKGVILYMVIACVPMLWKLTCTQFIKDEFEVPLGIGLIVNTSPFDLSFLAYEDS